MNKTRFAVLCDRVAELFADAEKASTIARTAAALAKQLRRAPAPLRVRAMELLSVLTSNQQVDPSAPPVEVAPTADPGTGPNC